MAKIVISYRRADSEALTGRIRDRLVGHYGDQSIFMDIDSIPFGIDFRDYIKEALAETDVVLAIMGPRWIGASATGGPSRISEDTDPVRIEVETALARKIPVIPVLVDNAIMPQPSELPETLRNLAYRNAAVVDSGRDFHLHMDRLVRAMDKIVPGAPDTGGEVAVPPRRTEMYAQNLTQPPRSQPLTQTTAAAAAPGGRNWFKYVAIGLGVIVAGFVGLVVIGIFAPDTKKGGGTTTTTVTSPGGSVVSSTSSPPAPQPAPTPAPTPAPQPSVQPTPPPAPQPPPQRQTSSAPPATCGTATVYAFRDNFSPLNPGWDDPSASRYVENGQMVFNFKDPGLLTWLYRPMRFKAASVCATVRAPPQATKLDGVASGGVAFWATDYQNYYLAQVYIDGTYQVYRRLSGEWIPVVPRTKSEHLRTGLDSVNELQVTFKESNGTFFANGQKLVDFRGQPPKDGGAVGLHGESESDRGNQWRFTSIAVVEDEPLAQRPVSSKAQRAATAKLECKQSSDTAFADDFKRPDGGWGDLATTAFYDGGNLVIKPQENRTRTLLYSALRYVNATACVNLRWPSEPVQAEEIASGGIAFWGQNNKNFYEASLFRDGTFDIYRLIDDEWVTVVKRTKSAVIKTGANDINQLKVGMSNGIATLYINDTKVTEIPGQPPRAGGAIGLFGQSDKERPIGWRFVDAAVVD
ncbi:hypothetical protein GJW-30_1_03729 [Variibacter gotjawalensis]|uniref:TIR domain-containing protein n=1 Tax=Variibacter gotjawalensis TaxID=1333996 RepID=A0A0S3PZ35_9BRAD|nr:toll/interleukin-1 receptor domain-containing protein [Variibacter gotjawalensis]NIK47009.1 hypothetical protein [Variibacter gotjawalensis]RZS48913.1 TIR domain-containing protein [Variibacter gotjawalensis]BAT61172.1 hypothetical protein GJW-30_1_03729 [Variibacter gotjawalensis]